MFPFVWAQMRVEGSGIGVREYHALGYCSLPNPIQTRKIELAYYDITFRGTISLSLLGFESAK